MPHMTLADSLVPSKPIHFDVFLQMAVALGMPAKRSGLKNKVRAFLDQKVRMLCGLMPASLAYIPTHQRPSIFTAQTQARVARSGHDIHNIHSYTITGGCYIHYQ